MEISRTLLQSIYDNIVTSQGYKYTVGPTDKQKVTKAAAGQPAVRPKAKLAAAAFDAARTLHPVQPPQPIPTPPQPRYAPRAYNLGGRDQDPRFCCRPEYGVRLENGVYVDEMGCTYDTDKMLNGDGKRDRSYIVEGLKGADSMDGREPCDPVTDVPVPYPPYPGDPQAQTGSYHR